MFEKSFHVSWVHLDANAHMANTAYLDIVVDVRFMYFASQGFGPEEFRKHRIGPVVRRDEVDYYKELHLLQPIRVNILLAGLSEDASRFRLRNEIRREDGELAARVTSLGAMFDLGTRKIIRPPDKLAAALQALDRAEDFEPLPMKREKPA
jgi:acyl-CoA thioester hydrolase